MRSPDVVGANPRAERLRAARRARVGTRIRPFADQGLDEAFGLAIGLGPVRPGAFQTELMAGRDRLKALTPIVAAVVRQHTQEPHTAASKPGDGTIEEARRRGTGLIREHFDIRRATVVIDRDMRIFPADALHAGPSIAMNPMPDARDSRQWLHIQVDQVAGVRPFVSADRWRGHQPRQAIQSRPREDRRDGRSGDLELDRDGPRRPALIARGEDASGDRGRGAPRLMLRRRGSILQRTGAARSIASQPFIRASHTDPSGRRRGGRRPLLLTNPVDEQGPHVGCRLGVTMKLHSGSPLGLNGTCGNAHSFQGIPSEQPH